MLTLKWARYSWIDFLILAETPALRKADREKGTPLFQCKLPPIMHRSSRDVCHVDYSCVTVR